MPSFSRARKRLEFIEHVGTSRFVSSPISQGDRAEACTFVEPASARICLKGVEPYWAGSTEEAQGMRQELAAKAASGVAWPQIQLIDPVEVFFAAHNEHADDHGVQAGHSDASATVSPGQGRGWWSTS
jgi:hypothetical protein